MALKLFLHAAPNSRKGMKAIVKIIQKTSSKIFGINAFLGPFFVIVSEFLKILPPGNNIKTRNFKFLH